MNGTTYEKGNVSESLVLSAYLKAGFTVSIPFGTGAAYDFIVDAGTRFFRIQVKTGRFRKGCVIYNTKRRMREASPYATRSYTDAEVDNFASYYPPTDAIFVVPRRICGSEGCLRLDPVNNGQQKFIRWASEFSWEEHVKTLAQLLTETISDVEKWP